MTRPHVDLAAHAGTLWPLARRKKLMFFDSSRLAFGSVDEAAAVVGWVILELRRARLAGEAEADAE